MSKRACPFEATLAPQHKIHVTEKEVCLINKNLLEKVHSKTINLLLQGAKKPGGNLLMQQPQPTIVCIHCNSFTSIVSKCWFCENILCKSCQQICNGCAEPFCKNCSMNMYNDEKCGAMCYTCT